MAYRIDDRWLWLGAGVALFIAVKGISYAIHDTVRLTEVQPLVNEQDEEHQKQPEDCTHPEPLLQIEHDSNTHPSNLSRCPPHPRHLTQPQHKQIGHRPDHCALREIK